MDFKDKIVFITGSSRGIGAQMIYDFAKYGANVVINYNNSYDEALKLKTKVEREFSSNVLLVKGDISNENDVLKMVSYIICEFGKIDILVNNAGICCDSLFDDKTKDNFIKILEVNLIGTYLVSREVAKFMNDGSKIINISSDNAFNGYPESLDYDSSKAGIISLTHNMAQVYSPKINVNCVCPGWVNTDMNKDLDAEQVSKLQEKILLGRFASKEEISSVVLFLASDKASYVNDSIITVNGGVKNV